MDTANTTKRVHYTLAIDYSGPYCVMFYYRNHKLNGKPGATLSLSAVKSESIPGLEIFKTSVDHGKKWIAVKRDMPRLESVSLRVCHI
jgi:hypothetical protein